MYRDRASLKRSCKNANELEFFETSEGDYREWLEQIKLQKKDNLKNLKVVEWCLERDGSMLDAEMEYRISVDDMVDLEEIEKDEPDLRKGDIPKYEEAKSASNKADYMRMSVAEKVRCYPFDEKRTEQIIETMGLLGINAEKIAEYPASVLAEVFGIGDMEYFVGLKLFTRVIDRLGVDMTHQERYGAFDRIYGEGCERRITSIIVIFNEVNRLSAVAHELAYVKLFAVRL